MSPKPCYHCGLNFMPPTPDIKLCNYCLPKELERQKKEQKNQEKKMPKVKILIECDVETSAKIEEKCLKLGLSLTDYFLGLYLLDEQTEWKSPLSDPTETPKDPAIKPQTPKKNKK